MTRRRDTSTLIEVARMYYIDGLDQGEVARAMNMSRSSVSRMLRSAREQGLVHITIVDTSQVRRDLSLESAIRRAFPIRDVLVAEPSDGDTPVQAMAKLAADVFDELAPDAMRIGISWGNTIGHFVDAVSARELRPDAQIVPLVGGMSLFDMAPSGTASIITLAQKCSVPVQRFDAPSVVESAHTFHAMMSESTIQQALHEAESCDLAFVGIGTYGVATSRQVVDHMKLDDAEQALVAAAHPVGDINGNYLTINGTEIDGPINQRVIGLSIEQIRRIETVVGLAVGAKKAPGTLGALRSGVIDILVTDTALATALMDLVGTR